MDMKKILQALDKPAPVKAEGAGDMKRLLQIMEGNNRLTQAENIIMQESPRPVTQPMLNKSKDAKPSMIGKYFRTVETELAESQQHKEDSATRLAKRVMERVMPKDDGTFTPSFAQQLSQAPTKPSGGNVQPQATVVLGGKEYRVKLEGDLRGRYSPAPGTPRVSAQGYIEGDVITLTINPPTEMKEGRAEQLAERVISKIVKEETKEQYTYRDIAEMARNGFSDDEIAKAKVARLSEGLKDPKDNPCWKGYKPVGTKKKGGRTVPNCVPK